MKRILFIGDIHGLDGWDTLAIRAFQQFNEVVFLGDYVDSFFVKPIDQIDNLKNLCDFIRKYKNRVTALFGNHDYAYLYDYPGISGHQHGDAFRYKEIFQKNIDLFTVAWGYTNPDTKKYTLATHAGLTLTYWNNYIKPELEEGGFLHPFLEEDGTMSIHQALNYMQSKQIMWKVGNARGGMGTPGPLWADYSELVSDRYPGINQIFGHTPQISPRVERYDDDLIICIDTRGNEKLSSLSVTL